jgi:5'-3' exonuclease
MYDYVFLCFLLGNDFLPHFPALNIRTHGMQRLLDVYRQSIGNKPNIFLITKTNPFTIQWKELYKYIQKLSQYEHEFIIQEYEVRKKWDYMSKKIEMEMNHIKDVETIEETIQNAPVIFRQDEKYICPSEKGWEERYYNRFFAREENKKERESTTAKGFNAFSQNLNMQARIDTLENQVKALQQGKSSSGANNNSSSHDCSQKSNNNSLFLGLNLHSPQDISVNITSTQLIDEK